MTGRIRTVTVTLELRTDAPLSRLRDAAAWNAALGRGCPMHGKAVVEQAQANVLRVPKRPRG